MNSPYHLTSRTHFSVSLICLLSFLALEPVSHGAILIWDENTEADLAGYKVYYGTSARNYTSTINVEKTTENKLRNLKEGITYYMAVTAYDISQNESEFSVERNYFVDDGIPDDEDNCPDIPNGPDLGTCAKEISGIILGTGVTCIIAGGCETGEICQINQEDFNVNGIGDACECYGDFDGDGKVLLSDQVIIRAEYERENCNTVPCQADLNHDGKVGLLDLVIMRTQIGRIDCAPPTS